MSNCGEPVWDIDDEVVPGESIWWSQQPGCESFLAVLPVDPPPTLSGLGSFAGSVLEAIAGRAREEQETEIVSLPSVCGTGQDELALPFPLSDLAEQSLRLIRHVQSLEARGIDEPDYEAGYLVGRIEHAALKRFTEMGKKFSETGKARLEAINEAKAASSEELRIATEEKIADLMMTREFSRADAIKEIARKEGKKVRSIQKRVEKKRRTN